MTSSWLSGSIDASNDMVNHLSVPEGKGGPGGQLWGGYIGGGVGEVESITSRSTIGLFH